MEKEPHGSFSIYSHRANRRAISHAQHGVVVPAWVAFAKQLRLGQWQYLLIIEQPFEQLVACSTDEDSATRGAFAESTCQRVKTKLV